MEQIILVDKPEGVSSFGVVARVRRKLTEEMKKNARPGENMPKRVKVGHAGTLDPFATGLLILLVGKATKRAWEFLKLDKEYIATMRLGATSTTGDVEGEITEDSAAREVSREEIEEVLKQFTGKIKQTVPKYSAVKINGRRAYRLAREGKEVEMPTREVEIYKIEIVDYKWPELTIKCKVSSGTYIRALGEDIGGVLGTKAYLTKLRRTKIDKYNVEDAMIVEK